MGSHRDSYELQVRLQLPGSELQRTAVGLLSGRVESGGLLITEARLGRVAVLHPRRVWQARRGCSITCVANMQIETDPAP